MEYIEVKNVYKVIKGNIILENINLSLEKGKIYGFVGSNGAGKTMLFRTICGLIRPTEGEVVIDDKILSKEIDCPSSCGVILDTPGFWENQTGFECLKNIASIKSIIDEDTISLWMLKLGLNPKNKRVFRKYSLGMKQKLALAQAFMESPDLLILDEPTNALDEESIDNLKLILKKERIRGATILIASHNKRDIEELCDKVFKVDSGRIAEV
ncbi:ATP-binding cassette domain-containing protein [Inconstantimicrobium mannanitabidum]|uniref:Multidrug ABC transporter ATP-binding protein n=1 Tax=Inconstantimicrobium mannanitabidum TaxID=1604901 RepID=A0ACB5RCA7_9CLOT|nr:ATP-binding cassette domain-containing protein [Clostridium sp. TW13]GKX66711.1 multidrug ABC transporter ATP-binding protein [Clostridium sp. TW13]